MYSTDLSGTTGIGTVNFTLLLKVRCRFVRGERKTLQKAMARNMIITNSLDYYHIFKDSISIIIIIIIISIIIIIIKVIYNYQKKSPRIL